MGRHYNIQVESCGVYMNYVRNTAGIMPHAQVCLLCYKECIIGEYAWRSCHWCVMPWAFSCESVTLEGGGADKGGETECPWLPGYFLEIQFTGKNMNQFLEITEFIATCGKVNIGHQFKLPCLRLLVEGDDICDVRWSSFVGMEYRVWNKTPVLCTLIGCWVHDPLCHIHSQ